MGDYKEFYLSCKLDKKLPKDIKTYLEYLKNDYETEDVIEIPMILKNSNNEFFKYDKCFQLLGDSAYFPSPLFYSFEDDGGRYLLTIITNTKAIFEIDGFLEMIKKYIITNGHVGHYRHEYIPTPTILFSINKEIYKTSIKIDEKNNELKEYIEYINEE